MAPARVIYCVYAFAIFLILMLLVIPFVVAGSVFGKIKGGNFIYRLCTLWADAWFFMIGIFHRNIYASPHNKDKQ